MKTRLAESGVTVAPLSGSDFRAFIEPQAALDRDIVTVAKITME